MTKIPFQVTKGKIPQWALERIAKLLSDNEGKWLEMEIKPKKRSQAQSRYLHGVMVKTVLDHMNAHLDREGLPLVDHDDVYLFIKDKALGLVHTIATPMGDIVVTGKLRDRTVADFEENLEAVRAYFAQKGINIPLPRENMIEEDYKHNLERE